MKKFTKIGTYFATLNKILIKLKRFLYAQEFQEGVNR